MAGKAKVVVAVEVREDKTRFATMQQIESISEDDICKVIDGRPGEDVTVHTYGWKAYGFIMESVPNTPTTIYLNSVTGSTRFWEPQMFDLLLSAFLNCRTITFSEH